MDKEARKQQRKNWKKRLPTRAMEREARQERNTRRRLKFWKTYHDELHIEEKGLL